VYIHDTLNLMKCGHAACSSFSFSCRYPTLLLRRPQHARRGGLPTVPARTTSRPSMHGSAACHFGERTATPSPGNVHTVGVLVIATVRLTQGASGHRLPRRSRRTRRSGCTCAIAVTAVTITIAAVVVAVAVRPLSPSPVRLAAVGKLSALGTVEWGGACTQSPT
jgi:hypothetical protein